MAVALFLIVYSILVACMTFFTFVYYFSKRKKMMVKELFHSLTLEMKCPEIDEEMEALIDERLNEIIVGFKKKIPMINMVLSQAKEEELKAFAKGELIQVIPVIKQKCLSGKDFFEKQFYEKANQLAMRLWKLLFKRLLVISICVGALMGIIEIYLLSLINAINF